MLVWSSRSGYQYCYALQFLWVSIIKLAFQASIALLTIQANQSNTELTLQSHHYYHGTPGFNYLLGPTGLNYRASLPDFNCYTGPSDPNCFASHLGLNCYVGHLDLVYSAGPPQASLAVLAPRPQLQTGPQILQLLCCLFKSWSFSWSSQPQFLF